MKTKIITALILGIVLLASCSKEDANTSTVSYQGDVQTIVFNYCSSCHSGSFAQGGLVLDTFEQVKESCQTGTLLSRIEDVQNPMPSSGLMPQDKIDKIKEWANQGYAN